MPSPNFSAYTIQFRSVFGPNVWKYDLYQWNLAPWNRNEVGITESIHSSYSGPQFNMDPYYGMTQKNGKLYGFAGENNTPLYQWPGQIFEIDQDWGGRTKTIYSGLTASLPFGSQICNIGGFAYDKGNDCFTLLKGTTQIGAPSPPPPLLPFIPNGERYLHTWGVSHTFATPQLPFYSGVTCLLETALGLAYRNSELYTVAYISAGTPGLTFQHINTNSGLNTILSYCPLAVDSVINSVVSTQGWGGGDLTYDEVGDNFYFLSHNGTAKIDPQFYTWETVPSTATTQQYYGAASDFEICGFEIIEPSVTTTTTLCTEDYSIEVSPDYLNSTISLCDSGCTNCQIMYVSGCTAPHFGWCTASTTCFDLTLECCKTYCVEVLAPDGCSYTEYVTANCPSTTTTTTYTPPEPTTTTTTTECVCVYPVEYFNGVLSGVTYLGDTLEGTYCNDEISPFTYNHISNPINSILTHGILIKQTAWGSLPISNNWWSLIRDIGANNYLLVGTGSTLTTVYEGIPPLANDFLVTNGSCECTTTTTFPPITTTTTPPGGTTTTTTTLDPCDFGPIPLTGDCPTTTTTTSPPTTTTTTPDPCDFGVIPLTGDCITSTTTLGPQTTTTTTVPCCYECCLITGAWEIINTGTTGNNNFYSIHKTSPHNQAILPIPLKDPSLWGAIPHMFFQGFAKRTTNNFLYGAFLEEKVDIVNCAVGTLRFDLHIYQMDPNTGSGTLAQTYTGYDTCTNGAGIRTDELGEGCLGYDSLNDKLIFIPYNNTVHPVYQIQPWVNGSVTYLGDFTVMGSTPNQYAHMSGLSNIPGTNSFYCYLDECSFTPTPPGGTVNCNSVGGYVCGFDTTTLNSSILPLPINPLPNSSIAAGLLYDCEDLYIVRRMPGCSGCTPQQYTNTWIDHHVDQPGECAGNIHLPCAVDNTKFNFGCSKLYMSFNEFDKDGNLVTIDMLTGDTSCPFIFTITDPATGTFIGQWEYDVFMDGNYPANWTSCFPCCAGGMDVGFFDFPGSACGGGSSPCMNGLIFTNPVPSTNPVGLPDPTTSYEIKVEYGGMGTSCNPQYSEVWVDGSMDTPGQIVTQGIFDVGTNGNPAGVGTGQDQVMGEEYMKLLFWEAPQSGQVYNGDMFTASTNNWKFTVRHPDGSGTIIGSWEYELVRYPTGPGYPAAICGLPFPNTVQAGAFGRCGGGSGPCVAGTPAINPTLTQTYCLFFKNPVPAGSPIDLAAYGPGSSHFNDIEISWGENSCCSGTTDNLVLTKYTLPSGPITNTILGTISGVTALAGLECAGDFCEIPTNPCPTTTTTTLPVSTTTTTDPCASTTTTITTIGPPITTTTTTSPTTTTTTLPVPCDCECPPNPPSQCPCIFSGTNIYVFYDGSPSFAVSAAQIANNVVLPWFNQFIATLPGYVGCLYQAVVPLPLQQAESWLRFSRYPWEGTNAFTPTPIAAGGCASGLDMPIAANINDPNAVVISFVDEAQPYYHDNPWPAICNTPNGNGALSPPGLCSDWRTNLPNSWPTSGGGMKVVPTLEYLRDFDSFMGTYNNGVWDQTYGTPGNNGSFNSFVYTLPINATSITERVCELNAYAAVEGRVVPAIDFVDIGVANNGGGLYTFSAIKSTNPYCEHACFWDSGYGPGKTPDGRCLSGLTNFGFVSVHSHEYILSQWLGSQQNNNIGIATLSATVCFNTACTSGITVEECCITGATAEQWVVDNPGVVSGLIMGETFNDLDHNACYKIIPPPIPLPPNGITLNPQSPTFGIGECVLCMASQDPPYCVPTTTTTTKIYRTTTTTTTTIRQIWGVERCCCTTTTIKAYVPPTTPHAIPINFDSLGGNRAVMTIGDFVNIGGDVKPPTQTSSSNTYVDITLHFFEICAGGTIYYMNSQAPVLAPVYVDSSTGYLYDLPSPTNSQDLAAVQQWEANNLAFYNHVGAPNPGDVLERRHIVSSCPGTIDNIECIKYLGPTTEQFPTSPWFQVMSTVCGTMMQVYCQYWVGSVGDMFAGCCSGACCPCTTGTYSYTVLNVHNTCVDCRGVVTTRTFHIWEECVLLSYFGASTSFPPGMCITHEGLPGAILGAADYTTATGLDDVEFNSNVLYNWAGTPGIGDVVTINDASGLMMNSTCCLRYMGTITSNTIPWLQPAFWMSASVLWSFVEINPNCCPCELLQNPPTPGLYSCLSDQIVGTELTVTGDTCSTFTDLGEVASLVIVGDFVQRLIDSFQNTDLTTAKFWVDGNYGIWDDPCLINPTSAYMIWYNLVITSGDPAALLPTALLPHYPLNTWTDFITAINNTGILSTTITSLMDYNTIAAILSTEDSYSTININGIDQCECTGYYTDVLGCVCVEDPISGTFVDMAACEAASNCCTGSSVTTTPVTTTPPQRTPLLIPELTDIVGNTTPVNAKTPMPNETNVVLPQTYGSPIAIGWNEINVNGLAYLTRTWLKDWGNCVPTQDITACAYLGASEFYPGSSLANFVGVNAPQIGDFINVYDFTQAWPQGNHGSHCIEILDIIDEITYNTGTVTCPGAFGGDTPPYGQGNINAYGYWVPPQTPCPCTVDAIVPQQVFVASHVNAPYALSPIYTQGGVIPLSSRFADCQSCVALTPTQDCGCTDPTATNFVNQFGSYALTSCCTLCDGTDDNDCCTYTDSGCWDNNAWNFCMDCVNDCVGVPHNNMNYQSTDTSCCRYTCPELPAATTWDCIDLNWQWETPGGGLVTPWGQVYDWQCIQRTDGSGQYTNLADCSSKCVNKPSGPGPYPWAEPKDKITEDGNEYRTYRYPNGQSMNNITVVMPIQPSHLFQACWIEEEDYFPGVLATVRPGNPTEGVEWYASPNYIGLPCEDASNWSSTPSANYIQNNQDFYTHMGSPNAGDIIRWCYWNDNEDFSNYNNQGPTRIPGKACVCMKYVGIGIPDHYGNIRCHVANSNGGTTCADCDTNVNSGWGGSVANKGITWDDEVLNTGPNNCCCCDGCTDSTSCMPARINDTGCSGYTYTDLSSVPIGMTWYDATSGECFTHIADPGPTYFDFTAPVPNPGGPYIDCDACEQINEIICEPVTTTTTRPREIWGLKPCCCEDDVIIGVVPNVGDVGQAGGFVFHVDTINNIIYEVAPKSTEIGGFGMRWGCWGTPVLPSPTLGTSIGMGKINTNEIIAAGCPDPTPWATYLDTLTYNGYDDWFAPSYNEWIKLWYNIGPGQALLSPLYNLADIDATKTYSAGTSNPLWVTSSEHPANPVYDTIAIGLPTTWATTMQVLQKNFLFMWLRPVRSYNYATCSGYTTTDLSTVPIGNTWYDPITDQCYERIEYPGPTNYNVNVPLNGPYDDCDCCELTHLIENECTTTTTTIWNPPKTTTTTTHRVTTTTTTRPDICYAIKPCCCITGETYTLGSTGPTGGIVFYHDGEGNYLEAAPYDINLSNYSLPQNIIAANATDSAHTFTMWGCMNLYVSGTSREIFAGSDNTSKINNACTPDTYGYPCCPSCTTDVNWIRTNPCSGSSIPFTYNCLTPVLEGDVTTFSCTKEYIGTDVWPNPGSNLDAANITIHSAAHICSTFTYSGRSDWYLPTIKEMNEMYNNLVGASGGQTIGLENPLVAGPPNESFYSTYNFAEGGYYWTSSECDASRAEYFPMFNGFNNTYLSLGVSDGPNYPTGTPCSGIDSIFPELFTSELHSKSLIPYPDINNNIIQGAPKYIRPVRKFTSTNRYCSGCTETDLSFMSIGQVFYDLATDMCYERIAIPGPDLYPIAVVPSVFYELCEGRGEFGVGCLDTHKIICTTTTVSPTTTTTTAWSATTTTTTEPTTTTTTTCQGLSACCPTDISTNVRWCGDPAYPGATLSAYNVFYDTLTNACWDTIAIAVGPVISINYPPIPMFDCDECNMLTNNCTTTTTRRCEPFSLSACCENYVFSLTADCNTITSYTMDQTDIYEGQGIISDVSGVDECYVVVPNQPVAPNVPAGFTYSFWCTNTVVSGDPPCECSGCTETNYSWSIPCETTTTTQGERCDNCICLSGISHLEIFYTGLTTSTNDDVCLTSADGTYCLEEFITTQGSEWVYMNQNNCPSIGYYSIIPFQYVNTPPWEISSWVVQWNDTFTFPAATYQIATASTIVNTSIPASNPAWDLGQTVWEYIDNQAGPISVNPRNIPAGVPKPWPCYNYSGTSHTGCCTTYGLMTCCYDPTNPHWGEELCCNENQQWFNTVYDIPTLFSGTSANPLLIPRSVIHIQCPDMCLTISDENYQSWQPVTCAPFLNLRSVDWSWSITNPNPCLECKEFVNDPCDCVTTTTTVSPTTTTTTGPVTTTTTTSGPLGLEDCCDPNIQYVAAGALYTLLAGMNVGDAFYSTLAPCDCSGCWLIINNPVGPIQTLSSSPSFLSSSCAALNTNTNYQLCCPTTTTTTYGTTTTTTYGPTEGVRNCCAPYVEYIATGVILTWLQSNLGFGDVVFGTIITAPFSLQTGCWEYIPNATGTLVSVSISPNTNYLMGPADPCTVCITDNPVAACTTTTTTEGLIGIESCCYDPITGVFVQYVAAGAFETYLNGLTLGDTFEITFNIPGVGDITGCFKVISNPVGLTVTTFVTPANVYNNCYAVDASINFRCCEQPTTTTTTTEPERITVKHCCTGDVYELIGDAGALIGVAGMNNNDTFRLVVIGGPFDGLACCFHKCVGCTPIVGPISGTILMPVWASAFGNPQCEACDTFGQSDGCCPTTTTTTIRATLGLQACCEEPVGVFQQYIPAGTLATDILSLTLGTAHLFVLNGNPVCAEVINSPIGIVATGAQVASPPTDSDCHQLITWLLNHSDPSLRIPCCPVTTTTTCVPLPN